MIEYDKKSLDYIVNFINVNFNGTRIAEPYSNHNIDEIFEVLIGNTIYEGEYDHHRWYSVIDKVARLGEKYFAFQDYHISGDTSMEDMDLNYYLDTIHEVTPIEVTITTYEPV